MKTQKIISKRFKITKNKKVMHRNSGRDHFRSRKSGQAILKKRQKGQLSASYYKVVKQYTN